MSTSDESKETKGEFQLLAGTIEQPLKIAGALVAMAYVFGLVVLNVHLGRFGYHSLGLLQLDYVAAGLWSLCPIALAGSLGFSVYFSVFQEYLFRNKRKEKSRMEKSLDYFAGILIWIVLFGLFLYCFDIQFHWIWLLAMLLGLLVGPWLVIGSVQIFTAEEGRERQLATALLIWALILLPFYLVFCGRYLYERVPDKWGGGEAAEVVLIPKDDAARTLIESLGVQFSDAKRSAPVKLILATEKELLIVPTQQSRGVNLARDLVVAIVYE
jgi:hypothetical protein